jgi:aminomethyltransferase
MLKRTPLYDAHRALGAKMVPFGGWEMPVQYQGIVAEHQAVRSAVGMFDVSHMGEVVFRGPRAREAVQRLVTNDVGKLKDNRALYTCMCYPDGGIVDDCIVYRRSAEDVLVVVNASNIDKDFAWMSEGAAGICPPVNESDAWGLIAVQGPEAAALVSKLVGGDLSSRVPSFGLAHVHLAGIGVSCARTGYTGEDGFEIFVPTAQARELWDALLAAGVTPAGLGARDTLRLEARLSLYGNDIDQTTSPLEAGLGWVVKLENDFIGRDALAAQKAAGLTRKLVGFVMTGRGIARHDYGIRDAAGAAVGKVTSGGPGPTVGKNIGLGYVPVALSAPGTVLDIDCRGKGVAAEVVAGPFYQRARQGAKA